MTQKISPEVLASAALMASAIRSLSICEIISTPHQLPDDPPPPNEPPPPEKPPPSENPPEEPEDQSEPDPEDQPLDQPSRDLLPLRLRGMAPTSVRNTNPKITTTSTMIRSESQPGFGSDRLAARCCHSAASPVSTLMMSSTPRVMPPGKSPARNRGVMALSMMSLETASVSAPSRP